VGGVGEVSTMETDITLGKANIILQGYDIGTATELIVPFLSPLLSSPLSYFLLEDL